MSLFNHPQEVWDAQRCAKAAKHIFRDGMGTPGGPKGLVCVSGSSHPTYGTARYNGGCIRDGEWYEGEYTPFPIIPETYRFRHVSSWGTIIEEV